MRRVFFAAVCVGLGLHVGVAVWDFVITPQIGRIINGRYKPWNV